MVMKTMRKNFHLLKWIIWAVVAAFVLSVGLPYLTPNQETLLAPAVVNGSPVSRQDYLQAYQAQLNGLRDLYGNEVPPKEQNKIKRQILDAMIDEELARQGAMEMGFEVSDQEYQQVVQTEPSFRNRQTGAYDHSMYLQFLQRQISQGLTVEAAESNIRRGLMVSKARSAFGSAAVVSPLEVEEGVALLNRRVKADTLLWRFSKLEKEIDVTDDEISSYYSQNRSQWRKSDEIRARHILIKVDAGTDSVTAKAKADELYKKAKAGADFSKLARENSEDEASAANGGDLDYFSEGDMVPAFEQAAFALKKGEISQPVFSQFGWHIIKLIDRKKGFEPTRENSWEKAKEGLIEQRARAEARRLGQLAIRRLTDDDAPKLSDLAKELEAEQIKTGWYDRDTKTVLRSLGETAFFARSTLLQAKDEIPAEPLIFDKGVAVAIVTEEQPGKPKTDPEERAAQEREIKNRLQSLKAEAAFQGWIETLRADAKIVEQKENQ